jgi:citrate lyase beta subunit
LKSRATIIPLLYTCCPNRLEYIGFVGFPKRYMNVDDMRPLVERLRRANAAHAASLPGETGGRQPVHVVYGGAHLFKSGTPARLGEIALQSLRTNAADAEDFAACLGIAPALAGTVYSRVVAKLEREPIEDYRIDFEDGYGYRPDEEEDKDAITSARQLAAGLGGPHFPPCFGFRVKPLTDALHARSTRTLQLFIGTLVEESGGKLPPNFVVTLPKVTSAEQVSVLADLLDLMESRTQLEPGIIRIELMMETVQSIVTKDGRIALPELIDAARGRCRGAHLGAYDYSAECDITASYQGMNHPSCDFARHMMQVCLSGRGIWLADSLTSTMPVAIHKGAGLTSQQSQENRESVRRAWKLHFDDTRRSLRNGFYQGWDLHPGQLPPRYAAVYSFFLEGLTASSERLRNFVAKAAQATTAGSAFDDAATGQGLLNFFLRGMNCGAITEAEAVAAGLTLDELRTRSFPAIMARRSRAAVS